MLLLMLIFWYYALNYAIFCGVKLRDILSSGKIIKNYKKKNERKNIYTCYIKHDFVYLNCKWSFGECPVCRSVSPHCPFRTLYARYACLSSVLCCALCLFSKLCSYLCSSIALFNLCFYLCCFCPKLPKVMLALWIRAYVKHLWLCYAL